MYKSSTAVTNGVTMNGALLALAPLAAILAIMNGLNNAANAIGWAIGGGVFTPKKALLIASVSEVIGGLVFGLHIVYTISYKLISGLWIRETVFIPLTIYISTIIWSIFASFARIPISFSMAIIGSIIGAITTYNIGYISWDVALNIFIGWMAAFIVAFLLTLLFLGFGDRFKKHWKVNAYLGGLFTALPLTPLISKSLQLYFSKSIPLTAIFIVLYTLLCIIFRYNRVASTIIPLILKAMMHGANDSALIASILILSGLNGYSYTSILISALGIAIGILLWGHRVAKTFAGSIVFLDIRYVNMMYISEFIAMSILLMLGLPSSISLITIGAFIGFSIYMGVQSIRINYAIKLILITLASTPICIALSHIITAAIIHLIG